MVSLRVSLRRRLRRFAAGCGRSCRSVVSVAAVIAFCLKRLHEQNVLAMTSALSFRTLFALVPALVMAFVVLRSVGLLPDSRQTMRNALTWAGFAQLSVAEESAGDDGAASRAAPQPEQPVTAAGRIMDLAEGVERKVTLGAVGPIGLVVLIWTAITLMLTLERSFNTIFQARGARSVGRAVLVYWSVMTLAPVLLSAAWLVARAAVDAARNVPVVSAVVAGLAWLAPLAIGVGVVAAVYRLMPNTRVELRWAIAGAAVAVPVWAAAKWAFSLYVTHVVGKGSVYGSLGLLPLFLLWVNLSWLAVLLGAQFAQTLQSGRWREGAGDPEVLTWRQRLAAALATAASFERGKGPVSLAQVSDAAGVPISRARTLMSALAEQSVVVGFMTRRGEQYMPAAPPRTIPLSSLVLAPLGEGEEVASAMRKVDALIRQGLGDTTLGDVLSQQ